MKEIKLTQGLSTIVNDEYFEELNKIRWCAMKNGNKYYAVRTYRSSGKHKIIYMHRIIMNTPKNMCIDHIDGNGLNNQKCNLRIVTTRQNQQNLHIEKSSKYAGICWHKGNNKWSSRIEINKKRKHLGYFDTELEAHNAYLNKLKEIGEVFVDNKDLYDMNYLDQTKNML